MAVKIWEGKGFDGSPIALYASGHERPSRNTKTGEMIQLSIMRTDMRPSEAVRTGDDAAVCGGCPLSAGRGCYVVVDRGPLAAWKSADGADLVPVRELDFKGRPVRLGMYGDPAAVPVPVLRRVLKHNPRWTGYTHSWRSAHRAYASLVMASVHSLAERTEAKVKGYRTFRLVSSLDAVAPGEVLCPASEEAGRRTTCAACGLCNGSRGPGDRRKDIAILAHGRGFKQALATVS